MKGAVSSEQALRYLAEVERQGVATVYWNNTPVPVSEVRRRLDGVSHVYLHRGLIYVP